MFKRKKKADLGDHYSERPTFYDRTFFLSISKQLLLALKEDLIHELIIISARVKGRKNAGKPKEAKFAKTFAHFPQCKLDLVETTVPKKTDEETNNYDGYNPTRWDYINENISDFDIFIDDSSIILEEETRKLLPDKTYVIPDYAPCRYLQAPSIMLKLKCLT